MPIQAPPTVDSYPEAPQRNQAEAVFVPLANAFVSSLEPRRAQMSDLAGWMNSAASQVEQDALSASQDASSAQLARVDAQSARDAALAVVGFAGKWADLAGTLNTPATVFHQGAYWRLLNDLADVTGSEPANGNADWLFVYSNAELRRKLLDEATLYADFANGDYRLYEGVGAGVVRNKAFDDLFNFSRASAATGWGASSIEEIGANLPRFAYFPDPTGKRRLLLEEQRTRLNTVSAAPSSPESVSVSAVPHTLSFYGPGEVSISGASVGTLTGSGEGERVEITFTPSAGSLTLTPSGNVSDLQLEAGVFASSVIRGDGSQVTRAGEFCSRPLGAEFNSQQFTVLFMGRVEGEDNTDNTLISINDGTQNEQVDLRYISAATDEYAFRLRIAGNNVISELGGARTGGTDRIAISLKNGQLTYAINGSAKSFYGASMPEGLTKLDLGQRVSGSPSDQLAVQGAGIIPRFLSEAEMAALTSPEIE